MPLIHGLRCRRFGRPADVLALEEEPLGPRPAGAIRVRMIAAGINPSDLIPIAGAYAHRITLPMVAGYEGAGVVEEADPPWSGLVGRRVLPLRGPGTWQSVVDADPRWTIVVPDDIPDDVAARAYINPLAALLMLDSWPVQGRRVLLTAGGSSCARLLGRWALDADAAEVTSVIRSNVHAETLSGLGLTPVRMDDPGAVRRAAYRADLAFEAVGGPLAGTILDAMPATSHLISYGLLSGTPFVPVQGKATVHRFHVRDHLPRLDPDSWRACFDRLWPRLCGPGLVPARRFPMGAWREALAAHESAGRGFKVVLDLRESPRRGVCRPGG
ncbi:Alcohol dehydrogenase GroES-like domain protein [Aquisphaera giovannonii]|uniref:Alcohol dehydrogenase GroES-like domain protein n=1 Tax=Aquisphaera giovannonii TaxID=406548 RepID=A0A5B9W781_9BACT|nr:zinc-dependent alcohol dehydrogenase family protein [Aquisphaera giovannonii]QEH35945.1 Alcohol dehydrogenase GroES-like domain protein [Aquisphaera giovannonii]